MSTPEHRTTTETGILLHSLPPDGARPRLLFDDQDYELVGIVNEFRTTGKNKKPEQLRKLLDPALHPRGIKELAATRARRIAYAVVRLLDSLEQGDAKDRIIALRALHEEVLHGGSGSLQKNTARVLLSIMKELVREYGNYWRQVELAHSFFATVSGKPRTVRRELRKHHLLEMPEAWNQVSFDNHVHDANTKGRKAPTHLIMDAWIKGIRELTVVYYGFVTSEAIAELTEAASIMEIQVRPGIEVAGRFRDKYVQFIWIPVGLDNPRDFIHWMEKSGTTAFFERGREFMKRRADYALELLDLFNRKHRAGMIERFGLDLPELTREEFLEFVGVGQPSVTHLADFVHHRCVRLIRARLVELRKRHPEADPAERKRIEDEVDRLDHLMPETILQTCLRRSQNPEVRDPYTITDGPDVPEMLKRGPRELLDELHQLRAGSRIVLNPDNLTPADVIELLYTGSGDITHIEIFNLKDYRLKLNPHRKRFAEIRRVVNRGSLISTKRMVRQIIEEVEKSDDPQREDRLQALHAVLADLPRFVGMYAKVPLGSSLGSDSVGRSHSLFGMGLVVRGTLPARARREFLRRPGTREAVPVRTDTALHAVWLPRESPSPIVDLFYRLVRHIPVLRVLGYLRRETYEVLPNSTRFDDRGNILTLGGVEEHPTNHLTLDAVSSERPGFRWTRLNSSLKCWLKVAIGFIPAFLTFYLTKDWWLLAWFGAVIWFAITGLRNVLQSVVGGGGLQRSDLLGWRDFVSWDRIADSLFYTGFSVPLLDWIVKSMILDQGFGVTTGTAPIVLYSVMGLANGLYLFSHNTFRGLPRAAAFGNFFRSVLSIPIAYGLNAVVMHVLVSAGLPEAQAAGELQKWAAVLSKFSSDLVAGVIEGTADRNINLKTRLEDYRAKLNRLIEIHGRLEAMYHDMDVLALMESPKEFLKTVGDEGRDLEAAQIINALDLMYFWMRQPRARPVFKALLAASPADERKIILRVQRLLERKRPVSEMFLDDLVGKSFSKPLAFYLDLSPAYLRDMRKLAASMGVDA